MEYSDLVYACALNRIFNYNCVLARRMVERFPSPGALFSMGRSSLEDILGKGSRYIGALTDGGVLEEAFSEVEWSLSRNVRILYLTDDSYPRRLRECEDAPIVLFYKGTADLNHKRVVSIVGTRRPDGYGEDICREIVRSFSTLDLKPLIVSGLAYGIDICAHREALDSGLETVGVMATGINDVYPKMHRADAVRMCRQGGVLTDFWRGAAPNKVNFLRRNRIIAGMCDAVILVESDRAGGGVVTSRMASSYSREVLAVPGRLSDRMAQGCISLIKERVAEIVSTVRGVSDYLGWSDRRMAVAEPVLFEYDDSVKRNILVTLSSVSSMDTDMVLQRTGCDYQEVMSALTELELEGRIAAVSPGVYRLRKS